MGAQAPHDWEVAVAGGLRAGGAVPLPPGGTVTVGRGGESDLRLTDPEVSRRHLRVRLGDGVPEVEDLGSRNGVILCGYQTKNAEIGEGTVIQVGETVLSIRRPLPADALLRKDSDGTVWFNRPPRIRAGDRIPEVHIPAAPEKPRGFHFPLATVLLPLLAAGAFYIWMPGSAYFLIFLALSPVMAIASVISDRRSGRKEHRLALKEYQKRLDAARERLKQLADVEELATRAAEPDPALAIRIATGPSHRLFERRPLDPDFLSLRFGLADRPMMARLTGPGAAEEVLPTVHRVPLSFDLREARVAGAAGLRPEVLAMTRAVLAQAATLHAPHDLGIVVLAGQEREADWQWAAKLPHTIAHAPELACWRMFGIGRQLAEARVAELGRLTAGGRQILLVIDGARALRDLPGLSTLLSEGHERGIYALCLDESATSLPAECSATVIVHSRAILTVPGISPVEEIIPDGIDAKAAGAVAAALHPLRVLGARIGDADGLPERLRYLELAGIEPTADAVLARWQAQPEGRSTRVLLGAGQAGAIEIDLKRDGPHALIAGTSGAGKSELLQSLVAGLALNNLPDAMNFVLVDYKGGSAFAECAGLPHRAGFITDLDGHLANRALTSLTAELRRREHILAEAGAKDIEDYWAIARQSPSADPSNGAIARQSPAAAPGMGAAAGGRLPRLVIVIDEFASLAEEIPEFITGVVGIGMRGRSLGIHVVLATQRPGGVVNAEIRANINLRICLRVTSTGESSDVIDSPEAARISRLHPGRGYIRTGHSDLAVFQAARIGWPQSTVEIPPPVEPTAVRDLGRPRPAPAESADTELTDLTALVMAMQDAATVAGVQAPPGPWLPPLPETVTPQDFLGLADEPGLQRQRGFDLDLDRAAPVIVGGMARSGRSTLLLSLANRLTDKYSPTDLHLYVLDYGGRALAPLAGLPHCGAYTNPDEPGRPQRILEMLTAEAQRRARAGVTTPRMVLFIDQYEVFLSRHSDVDGTAMTDMVDQLLRTGPAAGVLPVLAMDRSGFGHRLSSAVATRLVLRQAEPEQAEIFGVGRKGMPLSMPPGRFIAVPSGVEVQTALPPKQFKSWPDPGELGPRRVDALPESIPLSDPLFRGLDQPVIGAGGDHLHGIGLDLDAAFLVAGPPRSGRSTALAAVVSTLDKPTLVVAPRSSPLTHLGGLPHVVAVLRGLDGAAELGRLFDELDGEVVVIVDDAEMLSDSQVAYDLERIAQRARDGGTAIVAAGLSEDLSHQRFRGWIAALRRERAGLLLNPTGPADGDLFDLKLPRHPQPGPPGRGLLVRHGKTMPIQVPLVEN
ncbi:MAG TPA: FtsK/SpoIIIE domain-containing protein [Candidatus Limnocylindrales bacterium]